MVLWFSKNTLSSSLPAWGVLVFLVFSMILQMPGFCHSYLSKGKLDCANWIPAWASPMFSDLSEHFLLFCSGLQNKQAYKQSLDMWTHLQNAGPFHNSSWWNCKLVFKTEGKKNFAKDSLWSFHSKCIYSASASKLALTWHLTSCISLVSSPAFLWTAAPSVQTSSTFHTRVMFIVAPSYGKIGCISYFYIWHSLLFKHNQTAATAFGVGVCGGAVQEVSSG